MGAGQGVPPTMVGESGPKSDAWSTSVGESEGSLPLPLGMFMSVGESEGSLPEAGWSIRVGESEGVGIEPEESCRPLKACVLLPPHPQDQKGFGPSGLERTLPSMTSARDGANGSS